MNSLESQIQEKKMRTDIGTKTGKNVKVLMIISIILLTAFAGCTTKEQTITTPGGDLKVSQGSGSGPAWCKIGTKMTTKDKSGKVINKLDMSQPK